MQASDAFKTTIQAYLKERAANDPLFVETLKKPAKNIDDCITYIFNEVKKSGNNGFADAEVFGMAVHYYDEDVIEVGDKSVRPQVVVNHVVEITEDEKKQAKQAALDKVIEQERQRITKKSTTKKTEPAPTQVSLF